MTREDLIDAMFQSLPDSAVFPKTAAAAKMQAERYPLKK